MADLKKGRINLILVNDFSRLSRSISDFCQIQEALKEYGALILSLKEQYDPTTPAGRMMLNLTINLAQFEREKTAERVALGCHSRAMRGLLNGGREILGYRKSPDLKNSYKVHEEEADLVQTIFKLFLESGSLNRTIKKLEALGIKPRQDPKRKSNVIDRGLWSFHTLSDLLQNHAYIGIREVDRQFKNADPTALKPHQKYQLGKAAWPAIIDRETFGAVQLVLEDNKLMERARLATRSSRRTLGRCSNWRWPGDVSENRI